MVVKKEDVESNEENGAPEKEKKDMITEHGDGQVVETAVGHA